MSQAVSKSISLPLDQFTYLIEIGKQNKIGFSEAVSLSVFKAQQFDEIIQNIGMLVDSKAFNKKQVDIINQLFGLVEKSDDNTQEGN